MERLNLKRNNVLIATALSVTALTGCSVDSYLTNPSNVQCDEKRTKVDLEGNGIATFIVHGKKVIINRKYVSDTAIVKVRREGKEASVNVTGNITGPPQQLEADGFTPPTPVVNGAELSAFGAGGAWIIDVREDSVVIQGTCDGM